MNSLVQYYPRITECLRELLIPTLTDIQLDQVIVTGLISSLDWIQRDLVPRKEYYINEVDVPYTYGRGRGVRTYQPQRQHGAIKLLKKEAERIAGCKFEVTFLNWYHNGHDQLGWHADDSPEMDDSRPIAVISLGPTNARKGLNGLPYREFQYAPQDDVKNITTINVESGSMILMPAGMQDTHFHRIPKAGFVCNDRISITLRGYVSADK